MKGSYKDIKAQISDPLIDKNYNANIDKAVAFLKEALDPLEENRATLLNLPYGDKRRENLTKTHEKIIDNIISLYHKLWKQQIE